MAILSGLTLIRIHTAILAPIAYYLLTSPSAIADHNVVFMLGESMGMAQPPSTYFSTPNPITALAACFLILQIVTDLTTFSVPDDQAHQFWGNAVPLRVAFYFTMAGTSYLWRPGKIFQRSAGDVSSLASLTGTRGAVCNSLIFTWGFMEMVFWFWVFVTLREERKMRGARTVARKAEADADRM